MLNNRPAWSLNHKFTIVPVIAAIGLGISVFMAIKLARQAENALAMIEQEIQPATELAVTNVILIDAIIKSRDSAVATGEVKALKEVEPLIADFKSHNEKLARYTSDEQIRTCDAYFSLSKEVSLVLMSPKITPEIVSSQEQNIAKMKALRTLCKGMVDQTKRTLSTKLNNQILKTKKSAEENVIDVLIAGGVTIMLMLLVGYSITAHIRTVLHQITSSIAAMRLVDGEISGYIHCDSRDELGLLAAQFNELVTDLRQIMIQIEEMHDDEKSLRHKLQHALDQMHELQDEIVNQKKLAALGALVAGVAHELNTPIGNCQLCSTDLIESVATIKATMKTGALTKSDLESFADKVHESAQVMTKSMRRMSELIGKFKVIGVDQKSERRRTMSAKELIDTTIGVMKPSLKSVPVKLLVKENVDIEIDSFPGPISQILINLVQNAIIHAFPDQQGGLIEIESMALDDKLKVTVSDNGAGIDPAIQDKIFDPFFTTRFGQGGSGLGLNISHSLATGILGGKLTVTSTPGQGTTFSLIIPRVAPTLPE